MKLKANVNITDRGRIAVPAGETFDEPDDDRARRFLDKGIADKVGKAKEPDDGKTDDGKADKKASK